MKKTKKQNKQQYLTCKATIRLSAMTRKLVTELSIKESSSLFYCRLYLLTYQRDYRRDCCLNALSLIIVSYKKIKNKVIQFATAYYSILCEIMIYCESYYPKYLVWEGGAE